MSWLKILIVQIILLPGMDGAGSLFDPLLQCLSADTQAKVVSYPDQVHLSYRQLEELVVGQLPVSGKYIIVAESFSGPLALRVAERVVGDGCLEAVVLVASFAYQPLGCKGFVLARLPLRLILGMRLTDFVLRTLLLGESASGDIVKSTGEVIGRIAPAVRVVAVFAERDRLLGGEAVD